MPPSTALWQAVATVALPSFIFWSIAAIVLRETFDSDALLLYLILFALRSLLSTQSTDVTARGLNSAALPGRRATIAPWVCFIF
jgi:hypothetical protein